MYEFIEGKLEYINPSSVVVNVLGIGYHIEISLTTYTEIKDKVNVRILTHHVVREDAHQLYGFSTAKERQLFRNLISVNGIGVNTARMILSSMNTDELVVSIVKEDVNAIKSVKGIGLKTAQRVILELKDKLSKIDIEISCVGTFGNKNKEEALLALQILGFNKLIVEKALDKLIEKDANQTIEGLIKQALKVL